MMGTVIHTLGDMLHLYWAMLWYFILKLPFVIRVFAATAILYAGLLFLSAALLFLGKYVVIPLLCYIFEVLIQFFQTILFFIVKICPGLENTGSGIDDFLNKIGIRLEKIRSFMKTFNYKFWKKLPLLKMFIGLMVVLGIFAVVPFYMEPLVTGNANRICSEINRRTQELQDEIWVYVNRYYIPVIRSEETDQEAEEKKENKVLLHLGTEGVAGSNLRSSPEKQEGNVIKVIYGETELYYENEMVENEGIIWLKVSMEGGEEGWISKKLIKEEDLKLAGME